MIRKSNMYKLSVEQWNPFFGCEFDCIYCEKSFKAQAKRQKNKCMKCYGYIPHVHPKRLEGYLPRTRYMEYIFTCASGDISFCSTEYLRLIINRIRQEPDKTFLIQSKNPATFNRVIFPDNVILGTTIETDDDVLYMRHGISYAPVPSKRYKEFLGIKHKFKMVTIEPVLRFKDNLVKWIEDLDLVLVWLGYDSKDCDLPEPSYDDFMRLYSEIGLLNIPVFLKNVKKEVR